MAGRIKDEKLLGATRTRDASLDETRDASLEETIRAREGLSDLAAGDVPPAPLLSEADLEEARRLIESPEKDEPELGTVDPSMFVRGYEMARGGMGRIVAARDLRLGRVVAIKELIQDGAGEERSEREVRFEREALITARLQHPAIVNVYGAGRWPSGKPFYTMKLVAGRSLAQVAAERRQLADRFALLPNLIAMVEAVAYAHRQGIVHRDLKPSNVLIGDLGETVVIDWGLAKDLAAADGESAPVGQGTLRGKPAAQSLTVDGEVIGTPGYMPPEQAAGEEMDERADVYALGTILYQLLGGSPPYQGRDAEAILTASLISPPPPLARVEPRLPHDLVTIIEKAMAREPALRYPTAVQLAQDLRRFQTGQLVGAHRYSRRELVWRFLVRHRAVVTASLSALLIVAVVVAVSFRRVSAERDRAETASIAAARRADELTVAQAASLLEVDPFSAVELLARLSPHATPPLWRTARQVGLDARLRGIPTLVRFPSVNGTFQISQDGNLVVSSELYELRGWDLAAGTSRPLGRQPTGMRDIRLTRDGRLAATAGLDNKIRLWTLADGTIRELGGHDGIVTDFEFLPDGSGLVSAGADAIWLWRVAGTGHQLVARLQGVSDIDVSADGSLVAAVGGDPVARVWKLGPSPGPPVELRAGSVRLDRVALSPDGQRAAALGTPGEVWLWSAAGGPGRRLPGHDAVMMDLDFSADGRLLATGGMDRTVRLWDTGGGEAEVLRGHTDGVGQVSFAGPDRLFTAAFDDTIRVWMIDGKSASTVQVLKAGSGGFRVSDDGTTVVYYSDSVWRRWQVGAGRRILRGHQGRIARVAFAGDGTLLSAGEDANIRVWPLAGGGEPRILRGHKTDVVSLVASADGRLAASIDQHKFVRLWELEGGTGRALSGRAWGAPQFSPDGAVLAAPSEENSVRLWSTSTGEARLLRGHGRWVTAVAFAPDGRALASGSADRTIRVWDTGTGTSRTLAGHAAAVRAVEFAGPTRLVSSDMIGIVREWDLATGSGRELARAASGAAALAAAPGGALVAWLDGEGDAHLWSRTEGTARTLRRASRMSKLEQLIFSSDGRALLAREPDGQVIVWDVATDSYLSLPTYGRSIHDLAISPDSRLIATAESDHSIRLWSYDLPYDPASLLAWFRGQAKTAVPAAPGTQSRNGSDAARRPESIRQPSTGQGETSW